MTRTVENILVEEWTKEDKLFKDADNFAAKIRPTVEVTESTTPHDPVQSGTKDIHNALMAAGVTPGVGSVADMADAILYGLEGEFGQAGWSLASALPIVGQYVTAQRHLKRAKEAGEKIIKVYRGVDKWHPGEMVKNGRFVGGGKYVGEAKDLTKQDAWITTSKEYASGVDFAKTGRATREVLLEFHIPESIYKKNFTRTGIHQGKELGLYSKGVPKEFLTKVHKYDITPKEKYASYQYGQWAEKP